MKNLLCRNPVSSDRRARPGEHELIGPARRGGPARDRRAGDGNQLESIVEVHRKDSFAIQEEAPADMNPRNGVTASAITPSGARPSSRKGPLPCACCYLAGCSVALRYVSRAR